MLSGCASETLFFPPFAVYLPRAKSVGVKKSLHLQRAITVGMKWLPLSQGEFLHHKEKHCWQHCSVKAPNYLQATINWGSLPLAQTLVLPLKFCVAPIFHIL